MSDMNLFYLTGQSETILRNALIALYESAVGMTVPVDAVTGHKVIPQNDGRLQCHHFFDVWEVHPGVPKIDGEPGWEQDPLFKPGAHCVVGIMASAANPAGVIGPNDRATLAAAGIEVVDAVDLDADQRSRLPRFQ